ncbi:MAG: DUF4097 family beta strand repeat protein [Pseudobutyrivibrio sp.]|nr:DUF4097 family beta strand repeat protein [Pseudobutyrivibrio sp.]
MNKRLRNTILAVFSIITIGCIVFGTFRMFGIGRGKVPFWGPLLGASDKSGTVGATKIAEDIDDIDVILSYGDITIEKGNNNAVSVECNVEEFTPIVECKNGKLVIVSPDNNVVNTEFLNISVNVTVKDDIDNMEVDLALGDAAIKNVEVTEKMDISLSLGDLTIDNGSTKSLEVDSSLGNVDISKCKFDDADIQASLGDTKVEVCDEIDNYSMDLTCSLGDVNVDHDKYSDYYKSNNGNKRLVINCDLGDISVEK